MRLYAISLLFVILSCGDSGSSSSTVSERDPGKDLGGCTSYSAFINGPKINPRSPGLLTHKCVEGAFKNGTVVDRNWCSTYPPQDDNTSFDTNGCATKGRTATCAKPSSVSYSFYTADDDDLTRIKIICEEAGGDFESTINF